MGWGNGAVVGKAGVGLDASDRFVLFIGDEAFSFAGHFDALTVRRGVGDGEEFFGRNVGFLIESQEPAVRHRHVNGNDQIALRDDDGGERVSLDNGDILVAAQFVAVHDPWVLLRTSAGINA